MSPARVWKIFGYTKISFDYNRCRLKDRGAGSVCLMGRWATSGGTLRPESQDHHHQAEADISPLIGHWDSVLASDWSRGSQQSKMFCGGATLSEPRAKKDQREARERGLDMSSLARQHPQHPWTHMRGVPWHWPARGILRNIFIISFRILKL